MLTQKNKWFLLASVTWFLLSCYGLFSEISSKHTTLLGDVMVFFHLNQTTWAIDKIAHFFVFYIQTILILHSFNPLKKLGFIYIIVCMMLWTFLSEQLQSVLTITRHKDLFDVMTDNLGILFASVFFLYVEKNK
ncbi:MAG: hypothetical protein GKC53_04530 [Neisseriaceae bacterium]|nr:MAG: hypothetical protein GKC53_04530 [Neisseriaceae bacterium]